VHTEIFPISTAGCSIANTYLSSTISVFKKNTDIYSLQFAFIVIYILVSVQLLT